MKMQITIDENTVEIEGTLYEIINVLNALKKKSFEPPQYIPYPAPYPQPTPYSPITWEYSTTSDHTEPLSIVIN
ncbi:MAG: hypothetical protein M1542_08385 [Thermotogae bacterium]|jgi:hypothetical protein|nr:hypothetical protein [Thermotogota bacterium]MCL5033245.1 hypothetical protein [Thermotogota bacterium]